MNFLFGIPYYKSKIDSTLYDKERIILDIAENYKKSPYRNKWNINDDMHHSYNDEDNSDFIDINYNELVPLYDKHISRFLNQFPTLKKWKYKWYIENYTVTTDQQMMSSHHHLPSLFHAIHYLKFNPKEHKSTTYTSSHNFAKYLDNFYPKLKEIFDASNPANSWMYEHFSLETEEDDFLIVPSVISHEIRKSSSESLRITIVMNIHIDDVDKHYIL